MEKFVLPKKWYVKPNNLEEAKVLAEYFDRNKCGFKNIIYSSIIESVLFGGLSNNNFGLTKGSDHTEITFAQFKDHVLCQEKPKYKVNYIVEGLDQKKAHNKELKKALKAIYKQFKQ